MSVSATLQPFRGRLAAVGLNSFALGLVEASFLVIVTRSIITIADADTPLEIPLLGDPSLGGAAAVAAVLVAVRLVLGLIGVRLQTGLAYRVNTSLRSTLGHEYLDTTWVARAQQSRGTLQNVVVQLPANTTSLVFQLSNALAGGLSLLSLLVIAFVVDPLASLIVLVALIVLGSVLFPLRRAVRARTRLALEHQIAYTAKVSEVEDLGLEIDALGASDAAADELDRLIENEMHAHRRVGLVAQAIPTVYTTLAYGAIVVAILALDAYASDDLGSTSAVMLIMLRSLSYGQQIQQGSTAWSQLGPVTARIASFRDQFAASQRVRGSRTIDHIGALRFSDVTFAYDHEPVLRTASFEITRGEAIGVVGPSGAGKTTLVQLLLGLHSPTTGRVTADDVAISEIAPASWHRHVAYVPQETRLLDGSIADNVRFLRDGIDDAAVVRALQQAGLDLDDDRFDAGVNTDLGAAGRQFSGGQRQRLSIARALATNPSVIVLDEPTSSLDADSEEVIVETIGRLKCSVTVVVVTHRDSTLQACDRVLRVENGSVSVVSTR